jgi:hypothetical protein
MCAATWPRLRVLNLTGNALTEWADVMRLVRRRSRRYRPGSALRHGIRVAC